MELIEKSYLDDKTGEIVAIRHFADGEEIELEDYLDLLDDDNDSPDNEETTIEDLIHETTVKILETEGCPGCIEEVLYSFYSEIEDRVFAELDED